jgi:hypothetical protein
MRRSSSVLLKGPSYYPETLGHGLKLSYAWGKYVCKRDYSLVWNASIDLSIGDDLTVESVRYHYFADWWRSV